MDIDDRQLAFFARKLMGDLHQYYPKLLEQEAVVEAALGVGLDPEVPLADLRDARMAVLEEIERSLRWWLHANEIPIVEPAEPIDGVREGGPDPLEGELPDDVKSS
jgi:hypothetical protein